MWFDNFPYTNFHRLNLDWLIKKVREDGAKVDDFAEELAAMGVEIEQFREYIDGLDQEIQEKIETEIPIAIEEVVESPEFVEEVGQTVRKRRIVIFGDSYAAGWTPDGNVNGFPGMVQNILRLSNDDCLLFTRGGVRFGIEEGSEYAFDSLMADSLSSITNKASITDIVIAGGYNEFGENSAINAGIARCKSIIAANFSNPSLRVYLFAIGYHATNVSRRNFLFMAYEKCYAQSGWAYTRLTPAICNSDWWASDGYHPNQTGQDAIGKNIANIMMGGTDISRSTVEEFAGTGASGRTWYTLMTKDCFDSFLFGTSINYDPAITLQQGTFTELLTITTKLPLDNVPDNNLRQLFTFNAVVVVGGSFYDVPIIAYLQQTARDTVKLYGTIYRINDSHNGFLKYQNVTKIQVESKSIHVRIPYEF